MTQTLTIVIVALSVACTAREPASTSDATGTTASGSGSSEGTSGADSGSTSGDVPAACVDAGWDASLATYEALAGQADDTYWYAILSYEYIDAFQWGCSYRTTIEFVAGAPVRRTFELAEVADPHTADDCSGVPFVEEGEAVGTMDESFVTAIRTVPELYAGCCDLLALEPPDDYSFHFEVDDAGVVAACYAIENGCGEGCEASVDGFSGFDFETFAFGSPP